ncbi:MAG: Gfo/Idh/MocA family oxidoreductase [Planctomyces sp.]|nr:Gfo/Idh/MocA family oxidoreductase [Planctomyces sp.]
MSHALSRRAWLKTSALAGLTGAAAQTKAEEAGDVREITIGVMGMSRGMALAQSFAALPGVRVAYVADVDSERAAAAAARLQSSAGQAAEQLTDFRRILDDAAVDVLVCAAPNHWHAPATILACAAGKHVYVEKPCSHTPQEGEWMVAAARKSGRAVQMGAQRRSSPAFHAAISLLREGALGRVYLARCWYSSLRGSIGTGTPADPPPTLDYDLWQGPAPRVPFLSNRIHYNWHWFWHWGNGELGNNGVHALDICRWGLEVDYPIRATSSGGRYRFADDQETPDTHAVSFEFEGNRAISWQGLSCNRHEIDRFVTFYGDEGAMEVDEAGGVKVYDSRDKLVQELPGGLDLADHLRNFLTAIRTGRPLELNAEILEGHKSTLLCHLGNIAHRTGRTLNCNPQDGRILNDDDALRHWGRAYEPGWEPVV